MLYPPQLAAIQPALIEQTRRFVFNSEQGTGKSVMSVEVFKYFNNPKTLVVCPAIVRLDWGVAFDKFNSGANYAIYRNGKRQQLTKLQQEFFDWAPHADVQIVSVDLVDALVDNQAFGLIILDEIHLYKNPKALRSKQVRSLLERNPQAYVLGLTGTLAPNDVGDIHNPLDLLWPGRFGNKYAFQHRHQNKKIKIINEQTGEQRSSFYGLREDTKEELHFRLSQLSTRVTRGDLAEFLPVFDVNLLKLDIPKLDMRAARSAAEVENALFLFAHHKTCQVVDWVESTKQTTTHVCVAAHHKEIAHKLVREIQKRLPLELVVHVDGDVPVDKRMEMIEAAKQAPSAILVCTIQSTGLGISLTKFTQAICAEFHWSPGVMEQFLLRFSRLDSMIPSAMWFAMVPGTIDEVIATRLEEKFRAINPVAGAGLIGGKLESLLKLDEDEFLRGITAAAEALEEGGYV